MSEKEIEEYTYEEAFTELEKIVTALDVEQKPLEESIKLFERGQALSKYCADLLEKAELKITKLTDAGDEVDFEE